MRRAFVVGPLVATHQEGPFGDSDHLRLKVCGRWFHKHLSYDGGKSSAASFDDLLNSADLAAFKADFDAMRVMRRFGQDVFDDATRPLAGALVGFQDDLDRQPWAYLFPVLTAHRLTDPRALSSFLRTCDSCETR